MDEVVGRSIAERRFTMLLLASFAVVAVLLAAIGVYGVLAYHRQPAHAGDRRAARHRRHRRATSSGCSCAKARRSRSSGSRAGLAGALAAARVMTVLLFGVTTSDPLTFASVAAALAMVALLASYVPARRAARVDPMTALRQD